MRTLDELLDAIALSPIDGMKTLEDIELLTVLINVWNTLALEMANNDIKTNAKKKTLTIHPEDFEKYIDLLEFVRLIKSELKQRNVDPLPAMQMNVDHFCNLEFLCSFRICE